MHVGPEEEPGLLQFQRLRLSLLPSPLWHAHLKVTLLHLDKVLPGQGRGDHLATLPKFTSTRRWLHDPV